MTNIAKNPLMNFKKYNKQVDILIDDGLHSIIANINTIELAKNVLKPDGYLIIEDIGIDSLNLFNIAFELVANDFSLELFVILLCCLLKAHRIRLPNRLIKHPKYQ